jgi:class 3 adenylate cyclase/tetratricopeptide (TPR) repeat protein
VHCARCGTDNEAGRKFCKECGERLSVACPACGVANAADAKFCGECATRLAGSADGPLAASPVPDAPIPQAERRIVSILFADLVGFTALSEGRDSEETRELLTRYFDLARDVIGRYGGTVEKFIGDAVMAAWGAPTAHEDDAERAVRAGLDLVDGVTRLAPGLRARAGVLTGEAAVTIGAVNQGMVAGDLVNTASRLQSAAPPGAVLVGEATQRAAGRAIAFEPVGDQTLKGKAAPVPAWRALRVVAERGGRNRSETLEAPFVGRQDELRLLKDLFHATSREGRPRLMSVVGPAGIGKTRLAWEFLKYADGLADPVWWHDGRSPAYGDGISFWALGEMVRERCGLAETDDAATTRARVTAAVARHVPDPAERRWIEGALLALLGVESSGGSEQLFAAWRTFFERLAATAPVVLVFEDFHFADGGLIDFVDHMMEWSRNVPIYIVTLSRPELLDRRPDWGAAKRNFASLFLDPLSTAAMEELLAGLVPGLPVSAARAIVARADGMPLYAVETVRMLLAEGRLAVADGAYRPVGDLSTLAVPETLTALIASRLDALSPEDRALVADAAVLGQSFTPAGLAAVAGVDAETLEARLRTLVRREILAAQVDPRSPERGQYAFVQALIREVAYNTLARRDRKVRHLAAARFFESLDTEELAGALAGHYLAAHANSTPGPESDALAAQALVTLRGAAERATALASHAQAATFLEQALAVASDDATRAGILEQAGEAAAASNDQERGRRHLEAAIALQRDRGDHRAACHATTALVRILLMGAARAEGLVMVEAADAEFADLAEAPEGVGLRTQLARAQFVTEHPAAAIATADAVLPIAERLDLVAEVADLLVTKGSALNAVGRRREGMGNIETGRQLAESIGLSFTVLRATLNGLQPMIEDDPRLEFQRSIRGYELAVRLGRQDFGVVFREHVGGAALRLGDWDTAEALCRDGLDLVPEHDRPHLDGVLGNFAVLRGADPAPIVADLEAELVGNTDTMTYGHVWLVRLLAALSAGDAVAAREAVDWMDVAFEDAGGDAFSIGVQAHLYLWAGDAAAAATMVSRLHAPAMYGRLVEANAMALAAGVAAVEGRVDEALAGYRAALRTQEGLGAAFDAALVAIDMATLLPASIDEVRAAAQAGRDTLARVGAAPLLERLDAALAREAATPVR